MARDIPEMSRDQINNEIANHERLSKTGLPRYDLLIQARGQRSGLNFELSKSAIEKAARAGSYLSYGDLAKASGTPFDKVRFAMNEHLWDLVKWSDLRGMPMLSAIVVNQTNLSSGNMGAETLKGFVRAAEALGKKVEDPELLLRDEQRKLFEFFSGNATTPA